MRQNASLRGGVATVDPGAIEEELSDHFARFYVNTSLMKELRHEFTSTGHLNFPGFSFLPKPLLEKVHDEVHELLRINAVRRDITVKSTGDTYRKMYNVNQPEIKNHGKLIDTLYESKSIKSFLGALANDTLASCWEQEKYLITKLAHAGDTHGWHWGDYPYTLIWIIEAPTDPSTGGILQFIPHTEWDKKNPRIWEYILKGEIRSYHHNKGDVYFLKSDTTLHRVVPMQQEVTRIILNTCWASKFDRRESVQHESIEEIWGTNTRAQ